MTRSLLVLTLLFIAIAQPVTAQQLPIDRNMEKAVANGTRSVKGVPGNTYWQNKGDYDIDVNFDPVSCRLSGTARIDYVNNSPDTLKMILFKLYPNLYKGSSMRNTQIATADLSSGVQINSLTLDDRAIDSTQWRINGTNMYLRGSSVLPRQRVRIQINFAYSLNKGSFNRTGRIADGAYFIAYFFPRIAVYDDVDGWNEYPYLGKEEFYNDYGNFKVRITVPGTYQVWSTGDLKNTAEVYEPAFAEKISQAERQDDVIDVITAEDLKRGRITKSQPTNSWQFEAINVTDFAFAVSNNYVWKAASLIVDPQTQRRTRVDAVYNP
ncbi:MAG: peptidase, partial [Cytophagaceae bacterium]